MAMKDPSPWRAWARSSLAALSVSALVLSGSAARAEEPSKEPASASGTKGEKKVAADEEKKGAADEAKKKAAADEAKKTAAVDQPPADEAEWEREGATRRDGFIIGLQGNVGLGMASGYPLDLKKIGRARYYTETSIGLDAVGVFWVGVALKDWLSFGVGGSLDGLLAGDYGGWGPGGVLRLEAFPLWPLGGVGKDIGVTFDAGAGALFVTPTDDTTKTLIDGGAASYLGGGVFYEGIRSWRFSAGPGVYAGYMWSDTVRHGTVALSFRLTFYSGAAGLEKKKKASATR